jgi:TnpA family transposase
MRERLGDTADWSLIPRHLPDRRRVARSISPGNIRSSTILRNLGTESRQNRLYVAFRALGRVVRTILWRRLRKDEERRRPISAATTIAEAWNGVVPGVAVGGAGVIRQNTREAHRQLIRDNPLVAKLVGFHTVVSRTRILQDVIDAGSPSTPEIMARLSP